MSELINNRDNRATIRWKLLTSASALALTAYVSSLNVAKAEDADRPQIWIELGGQMENVGGQGEVFAPPFLAANPDSPVLQKVTPLQAQEPPKFSFGEEGKISFQPENSDWVFSAAARIGRSSDFRHVQHQTNDVFYLEYKYGAPVANRIYFTEAFSNTQARRKESHGILDFSAGKDVGLGMFGKGSSSVLSLGVRFAQFASSASFDIRARPEMHFKDLSFPSYNVTFHLPYFDLYHATGQASRSFHGVGPSLSWEGSVPVAGNAQNGEVTIDWGANAALLFGKQKARAQHQESDRFVTYHHLLGYPYFTAYTPVPHGHSNARSVTVPNAGGFAAISYRYNDAKLSLGYRADFFFGAMDTGIDTVKKSNLTFNGPYASISVGLGD